LLSSKSVANWAWSWCGRCGVVGGVAGVGEGGNEPAGQKRVDWRGGGAPAGHHRGGLWVAHPVCHRRDTGKSGRSAEASACRSAVLLPNFAPEGCGLEGPTAKSPSRPGGRGSGPWPSLAEAAVINVVHIERVARPRCPWHRRSWRAAPRSRLCRTAVQQYISSVRHRAIISRMRARTVQQCQNRCLRRPSPKLCMCTGIGGITSACNAAQHTLHCHF
jgi:hypothetical protein